MDLKPLSDYNKILKYADDTSLLVPQHSSVSLEAEFTHISNWSDSNKLKINTAKTKEIIFHRPRLPKKVLPIPLMGIEQVNCAKILGLTLSDTFSPTQHLNTILMQCNQRLYLLSQLKYQNLSGQALDIVFNALILSKISYALPAFSGHITTADKNRINKFFRKAYRRKLVSQLFDFDILAQTHDKRLFNSIKYPDHCLNFLLPQKRSHSRQLRPKGHDYTLSHIQTTLFKNSFLNRCLFSTL